MAMADIYHSNSMISTFDQAAINIKSRVIFKTTFALLLLLLILIGVGCQYQQFVSYKNSPDARLGKQKSFEKVDWIRDEVWFHDRVQKGCCPFAKTLYENRYAKTENRCCTSHLQNGTIDPLKAIGGADYLNLLIHNKRNVTILIQGDSLAEQHFLGMICYAWSEHHFRIELKHLSKQSDQQKGTRWQAAINIGTHDSKDVLFTIQYLRWNTPTTAPKEYYDVFDVVPDFIILGGWHHGSIDDNTIRNLLEKMPTYLDDTRRKVFVIDPLPSHFPGGKYRHSGGYPPSDDLCVKDNTIGDPNINDKLLSIVNETDTNVTLLQVSKHYHHRGNAHIGYIPKNVVGPQGRDCLHWCIAPGVLDALTKETLSAIFINL